jgi:EpsI family protein
VRWLGWAPAGVLAIGALLTVGIDTQRSLPLRAPLDTSVPVMVQGFTGADIELTDDQRQVAGVTDYLMRAYAPASHPDAVAFSLYVGYYDRQTQGRTIHSPKNCIPGNGWEALTSRVSKIATGSGHVAVNRYLIRKGSQRALVLYWYQGRGRVEPNEYWVKWHLLRDAALRRRTEEALVRVVVPVAGSEDQAFELGSRVVGAIMPALQRSLPN